jgi:hypothetical protein
MLADQYEGRFAPRPLMHALRRSGLQHTVLARACANTIRFLGPRAATLRRAFEKAPVCVNETGDPPFEK